jgi:Ni/Fe-hydrogenase 1 B-type cytochrome subunit
VSAPARPAIVQVYVWEWPVRLAHWMIVLSIAVCSVTGIYIGHPFMTFGDPGRQQFVMGNIKVIHFYGAIVFTLAVLSRIIWMFIGNHWAHWDKFVPVARARREGIAQAIRFYLFRLRKPPGYVGHNPLAGLTYTGIFILFLIQTMTGFGLYAVSASVTSHMHWFRFFVALFGGMQYTMWIHHIVMWLLIAFAVHHVYSAILMSQIEASATVESIFSGYKFVKREILREAGDWTPEMSRLHE